jgi:hypothetical protein
MPTKRRNANESANRQAIPRFAADALKIADQQRPEVDPASATVRSFTLARLYVKITIHQQIRPSEEFREVSRMATDVVVCARSAAPLGACDRHIRSGK